MELGARSLAALFFHAVAAKMNSEGDIRKRPAHILRGDPIFRVFGMIIVTIHAQAGRSEKIGVCAIAFLIGHAHIVAAHNLTQDDCIRDNCFMRVAAIARSARTVGKIELEFCHQ